MHYLYIVLSVIAGSAKSTFSKILNPCTTSPRGFGLVNTLISVAAALVILFLNGWIQYDKTYSLLLGILFGICTTAAQYLYMRAFSYGNVSVVTFIYSCGFLLPTAAGTVIWSEVLSVPVIIGCLLLLVSFLLCAKKTTGDNGKSQSCFRNPKGVLYAFGAMCCSGMLGILQKLHQTSAEKDALGTFLCTAFGVSALISGLIAVFPHHNKNVSGTECKPHRILFTAIVCGICIGIANHVNLILSGALPAALVFPITNGGVVVLSALVGRVVFRERLSPSALSGIILGIISVIIIGIYK